MDPMPDDLAGAVAETTNAADGMTVIACARKAARKGRRFFRSAILSRNKTAARAAALGEGVTAMTDIPSPAVAVVGRHNSGKTTLIERLIAELVGRGLDVGSIKHHSHRGFDIDIPGKDSYRHRAAGASETVIAAPGQVARILSLIHI